MYRGNSLKGSFARDRGIAAKAAQIGLLQTPRRMSIVRRRAGPICNFYEAARWPLSILYAGIPILPRMKTDTWPQRRAVAYEGFPRAADMLREIGLPLAILLGLALVAGTAALG
jgi:hypothetical protein